MMPTKLRHQLTLRNATNNPKYLAKLLFTPNSLGQSGLTHLITGAGYLAGHTGRLISDISDKKNPYASNRHRRLTIFGLV